jgi:hypothetical protein
MCNSSSSLEPLRAYHRLIELGDTSKSTTSELGRWIAKGEMEHPSQPTPQNNAGPSGAEGVEERRKALTTYFQDRLAEFKAEIESLDTHTQWEELGYTWEIRTEVRKALEELIKACTDAKGARTGI